jgi:rare lipoprotein A (peptidoglycan hydrolase)
MPPINAAPKPVDSTTATTTPVTVTVTLPAALTAVSPASKTATVHADHGRASWFHAADATCAHRTIPVGTVVTVTRSTTGASTTCTVTQWGPEDASRIIDLSYDTFEQLATTDSGLIDVDISW